MKLIFGKVYTGSSILDAFRAAVTKIVSERRKWELSEECPMTSDQARMVFGKLRWQGSFTLIAKEYAFEKIGGWKFFGRRKSGWQETGVVLSLLSICPAALYTEIDIKVRVRSDGEDSFLESFGAGNGRCIDIRRKVEQLIVAMMIDLQKREGAD